MIDTSPAALRKLARTLYQEEDLSDHEDALLVLAAEKEADIAAHGAAASRMMARDQTRFDAACEVMAYLKQIQAPHSCIHRMSTVLHGNTEGTPASRASDKGAAEKEAQPRPTDGELWDDALSDRDRYHDIADKLANAIAAHLGIDIGEHSNLNCPWLVALEALEQHHKEQPLEMVAPADAPLSHAERQVLRDAARDSVEVVHDGFDRRSWLGEGGGYGNGSIFAFGFDAVTHNNRQTEGFKP